MTRAVSGGTGSTSCAPQAEHASQQQRHRHDQARQRAQRMRRQLRRYFRLPKSTCGGAEIWASFCTVKLGLGS